MPSRFRSTPVQLYRVSVSLPTYEKCTYAKRDCSFVPTSPVHNERYNRVQLDLKNLFSLLQRQ